MTQWKYIQYYTYNTYTDYCKWDILVLCSFWPWVLVCAGSSVDYQVWQQLEGRICAGRPTSTGSRGRPSTDLALNQFNKAINWAVNQITFTIQVPGGVNLWESHDLIKILRGSESIPFSGHRYEKNAWCTAFSFREVNSENELFNSSDGM